VESLPAALLEIKKKAESLQLMVSMFNETPMVIAPEVFLRMIETQILNCPAVINIIALAPQIDSQRGSTTFEDHFDETFVIGPGGINVFLTPLENVFQIFAGLDGTKMSTSPYTTMRKLQEFTEAMLLCLLHLRAKFHRSLWDPVGGIRAFGTIYKSKGDLLPVCSI
jgi:hypothetical protein